MKSDLEELEYSRAKTKFTQTWQGTLWRWVEWIFAVYCIYKWIATTCNVLFNRTGSSDPITTMLSIFLSQQDDPVDTAFWSQQLSFWFAGMIVVGSIRGFLKLWIRLLHLFQLNLKLAPSHMLLFTAHMMGMYFLSSVLMMQMSLPTEYRYLLSTVEFDFFRHWSDVIVVVSSCVSCIVMYVIYSTHDAKSMVIDFADVQLVHLESGK
ncbi:Abscisic acid G-protein coupled receptor-like domain-containing protein [Gilbertella persicaria]|uniref:Abscisic acid G-protein coupled receptor-like domain-containing protein n=1 Tax=Gilbertella persicaria TaxID=101096 RepID=UPI00221EDFFC|nr:Abscisic acid G-protein coupled receptor-like domain-containing protein [Gilbertella persicaria]KAI8077343.1 Abscisic acid G-protein coupled receptor-like domain-containing protein [Gilbertella persicaria]